MRVALVVLFALFVFVPAAEAGTYDVRLCDDPAATGFVPFSDDPVLETSAYPPDTG